MNEIKAQEYLQWLDEQIAYIERSPTLKTHFNGKLLVLKEARDKFKSLMTKDYEHGEHGV